MILGVDEVGRGCWAGPVVAGAVMLNESIPGLRDSKKLSARQRSQLAEKILQHAAAYGLGWVTAKEVDKLGLTETVRLAMIRAVQCISIDFTEVVVDGNYNYLAHDSRSKHLIRADDLVPQVSAASILAKVARDEYMTKMSIDFPHYGFERHVGYGTKMHIEMLQKYGVCELHRLTYKPIKTLLNNGQA